jgi:hypothetical protein
MYYEMPLRHCNSIGNLGEPHLFVGREARHVSAWQKPRDENLERSQSGSTAKHMETITFMRIAIALFKCFGFASDANPKYVRVMIVNTG